jgi:hypothetical protein
MAANDTPCMEIIPRQLTAVRARNAPPGQPRLARSLARWRCPAAGSHTAPSSPDLVPGPCPRTLSPGRSGRSIRRPGKHRTRTASHPRTGACPGLAARVDWTTWWSWRGAYTRSHPELGREIPQRPWYCVSRHGRVGRRQVFQSTATAASAKQPCEAGSTRKSSRHLIQSPPPPTRGGAAR